MQRVSYLHVIVAVTAVMLLLLFHPSHIFPVENRDIYHGEANSTVYLEGENFIITNVFPHDPEAYTQGLVYHDGFLYESTGLHGKSSLRMVRPESGEILKEERLDEKYFGEGLAIWKTWLIQLTWKSGTAFVYDISTFAKCKQFSYEGEGWGLTTDGKKLIMSDGSSILRFIDPETFNEIGRIRVLYRGEPVHMLNELEFAAGEILANVWHSESIARIDPESGNVKGWLHFSDFMPGAVRGNREAVLNGIAYDEKNERFFITGKLWPVLYEVKLKRKH